MTEDDRTLRKTALSRTETVDGSAAFAALRRRFEYAGDGRQGPQAELRAWLESALTHALDFLAADKGHPLHGDVSLPEMEKIFNVTEAPADGMDIGALIEEARALVLRHSVHLGDPKFVGHMTGAIPDFALVADLLTTALNQNVVKIETALSASFLEGQTNAWMHRLVYGRDDAFYLRTMHDPELALATVTSGGTVGNLTALTVARNRFLPNVAEDGLHVALRDKGLERIVILASKRVHYSVVKVASLLGLGSRSVIEAPVVPFTNKVDVRGLRTIALALKSQGVGVLAVVGVAGSTETGHIDPLDALADLAAELGAWFHVDAAWGGALLFSKTYRPLLAGIERADSVTMDGHKLFYIPMSHGCVLFRDAGSLDAVRHSARYILRKGSVDLGRVSLEGSRRFDTLKLWFFLKAFGTTGYAALIERSCRLTRAFGELLERSETFELTSAVETNILTYRYLPANWKAALLLARKEAISSSMPKGDLTKQESATQSLGGTRDRTRRNIAVAYANRFLSEVNVELQKQQRQKGTSFVSRTTLESVFPGQETVVLRAVPFNPLTTTQVLADIMSEQEDLGRQIVRAREEELKASRPPDFETFFPSPS